MPRHSRNHRHPQISLPSHFSEARRVGNVIKIITCQNPHYQKGLPIHRLAKFVYFHHCFSPQNPLHYTPAIFSRYPKRQHSTNYITKYRQPHRRPIPVRPQSHRQKRQRKYCRKDYRHRQKQHIPYLPPPAPGSYQPFHRLQIYLSCQHIHHYQDQYQHSCQLQRLFLAGSDFPPVIAPSTIPKEPLVSVKINHPPITVRTGAATYLYLDLGQNNLITRAIYKEIGRAPITKVVNTFPACFSLLIHPSSFFLAFNSTSRINLKNRSWLNKYKNVTENAIPNTAVVA